MKKLIVQFGHVETEKEYFDFIAFDGEYWKGKKEIYTRYNGLSYIDAYYYDTDVNIDIQYDFGNFSADHYEQLTHEIILLADHKTSANDKFKQVTLHDIKNLVKTYKNDNNI